MQQGRQQRVVIGMIDGMGMEYFTAQELPALRQLAARGLFRQVSGLMPSITNVNNVSICCGAYPAEHGITGNSYFDPLQGREDYMEDARLLLAPTLFQRAAALGIQSALLTSKKKTLSLLGSGAALKLAAEAPAEEFVARYGSAPSIYSREINYWLWQVAVDLLKERPEIGLVYVHTTDFPMHKWAPEEKASQEHMQTLDRLIGQAAAAAPDAAFLLTADHGMNPKRRCWDLQRVCLQQGTQVRYALSAEKDRYVLHHRTFGGTAYVWLQAPNDLEAVRHTLERVQGVELVLTREQAAERFHLLPDRIGDVVVIGDKDTVFGELETEGEELEASYRSHGSLYELAVPLIMSNFQAGLPEPETLHYNADLTRQLYRAAH
ncbi:nucleotide pyrophosphatase [Ktedonosporobacter rubrisoli]|uniref:Nucleotide pyrophosphatase n=1 Tax=Ktedonosporobacter rubrisoli TaxID=2509675 RepID=A0A4P6JLG9_KTERU|nr:alkaline phosphatase family protein [Ktedonosporobacter rubrisoli]QBD75870.1 nucleotide pyrophosphatase [Ktedonosporobacter rubrisoli]